MRCEGEGVKGEEEREGGRKISKGKATEWDQWVTAQSGIEKRPDDSKETQGEGISQFVTPSSPEETKMEPPRSPSFMASVLKDSIVESVLSDSTLPYEMLLTRMGESMSASASAKAKKGSLELDTSAITGTQGHRDTGTQG